MIFQEQVLERLIRCPLMTTKGPSKEENCAYTLASWILRKAFEDKLSGSQQEILHNIRGKIIELWKEHKVVGDPGRLARIAGFRLFNLILDYEVLHLEQPYNLVLAGYTIQGKYALLRKRKGANLPHVLILHTKVPAIKTHQALPPDITTMARLMHIRTTTKYSNALALHYPVFYGEHWFNKDFNTGLARKYLEDMLKIVLLQYPVVGSHCTNCDTKPCLEVFRNG